VPVKPESKRLQELRPSDSHAHERSRHLGSPSVGLRGYQCPY
jgi:hypothetical protein